MINTLAMIREKTDMLESLSDLKVATRLLKQAQLPANKHPLELYYQSLGTRLDPVDSTSAEWQMVQEYLQTTHAPTHTEYRLELMNLFQVTCKKAKPSSSSDAFGNRMLLWHGSRLSNWVGILSHGLKIAPAEAPSTGYMFGKGVYFADMGMSLLISDD